MKIKPADKTGGVILELGPKETQLSRATNEANSPALPVFQLKRILVPLDFTECAEKALFYAAPLAKQFGAELALLHVIEPVYSTASEAMVLPVVKSEGEAKRDLEALRGKLPHDVCCEILLRTGRPQFEIVAIAKEHNADLIILSTHGRTGVERLLMGSVAEHVVRHAPCPVLIVRQHEHEFVSSEHLEGSWNAAAVQTEEAMKGGF